MKSLKKILKNIKASNLTEKIMVAAFSVAAGGALIAYMSNVIIENKAMNNSGILDGSAERNRIIPEEEGTPGLRYEAIDDSSFKVVGYNGMENDIVIPSLHEGKPVTEIGLRAFKNYSYGTSTYTSVTVGGGIQRLSDECFFNLSAVTKISLPDSINYWGACIFMGCASITEMKIPTVITELKTQTFDGCRSLKYIYIPKNIQSTGLLVFSSCYDLRIECEVASKPTNWDRFWNCCSLGAYWQSCTTTIPTTWNVPPH